MGKREFPSHFFALFAVTDPITLGNGYRYVVHSQYSAQVDVTQVLVMRVDVTRVLVTRVDVREYIYTCSTLRE